MEALKVKDLKKIISDLEKINDNIDEFEIYIIPCGTPAQPVLDISIETVDYKNVLGIQLCADVF